MVIQRLWAEFWDRDVLKDIWVFGRFISVGYSIFLVSLWDGKRHWRLLIYRVVTISLPPVLSDHIRLWRALNSVFTLIKNSWVFNFTAQIFYHETYAKSMQAILGNQNRAISTEMLGWILERHGSLYSVVFTRLLFYYSFKREVLNLV